MKVKSKADFGGLKELQKALNEKLEVRVGVLSSTNSREDNEGATNAELAMVHEFGSFTNNIPPRSFLRMPIEQKADKIKEFIKSNQKDIEQGLSEGDIVKMFEDLGIASEAVVKEAFETAGYGQWKPNKPETVKAKGSASPLIDSSQLRESIINKVVKLK